MGRHKEWRKTAKRERRRKIRVKLAKEQSPSTCLSSNEYKQWLIEQENLDLFELEQIEIQNEIENNKWLKAEADALEKWNQLQEKIKQNDLRKLEDEARIKKEWEEEQKKVKEAEEKLQEIKEQNRKQQEQFKEKLQLFLSGDNPEPPDEMLISKETRPGAELCPFFVKTACCRFGDQCSRNHQYPGISKVLLATNLYTHFGLDNTSNNEYDTDLMLEFEDTDMYRDFKEFYSDVLPEFQKCGEVVQFKKYGYEYQKVKKNGDSYFVKDALLEYKLAVFASCKVCNNFEKHLRGNTYIEFAEPRSAVSAYINNHGRWYGGKQISLQFCLISSWKNAICGLQSRRKCPKGRACNFLHVFRNPNEQFYFNKSKSQEIRSRARWLWSESPEREELSDKCSHRSNRRRRDRDKSDDRSRHDRRHRRESSSRSRRDHRSRGSRSP